MFIAHNFWRGKAQTMGSIPRMRWAHVWAHSVNGFERLSVRLCKVYFGLYYYWHWLHPPQKVKWQHKKNNNNMTNTFLNSSILGKSEFPLSLSLLLYLTTEEDNGYKKVLSWYHGVYVVLYGKYTKHYGTLYLCFVFLTDNNLVVWDGNTMVLFGMFWL